MNRSAAFTNSWLSIDSVAEIDRIVSGIRAYLGRARKKGLVVALSGGVDSSVVASLCVRALGSSRVLGLLLPERESSPDTLRLSRIIVDFLGVEVVSEDITPVLEAAGCYRRRDDAIRTIYPEFGPRCRAKIVLPTLLDGDSLRLFSIVIRTAEGSEVRRRLTMEAYLGILSASNFKQRVRKMMEYYQADRLNFAVAGTPNRLEYDQGFFVKLGDGSADIKPIAHLYKTQVYQLAEALGVPEEIRARAPTTDTYSLPQSQEEFYFSVPYHLMDLCLFGKNNAIPVAEIAEATGLSVEQVQRVLRDIDQKRKTTVYLHQGPELIASVREVGSSGE